MANAYNSLRRPTSASADSTAETDSHEETMQRARRLRSAERSQARREQQEANGSQELAPAQSIFLVFYPDERDGITLRVQDGRSVVGRIYVLEEGNVVATYEAAGGPKDLNYNAGGHFAGRTVANNYTLAAPEHHTTANWSASVVPWGAKLRMRDLGYARQIEYSTDGKHWLPATGPGGKVTEAIIHSLEQLKKGKAETKKRGPRALSDAEWRQCNEIAESYFYDQSHNLMTEYKNNDFGNWAFNLTQDHKRSPFYVHTTPADEKKTEEGEGDWVQLEQSHGCVHIRPVDRDRMLLLGYLRPGVHFTVMPYGMKGPPPKGFKGI